MLRDAVKAACEHGGTSIAAVAGVVGTSRQNLHNRLGKEKLRQEELEDIAKAIGCKYQCYFEFPDGRIIGKESIPMRLKIKTIFALSAVKSADIAPFFDITVSSFNNRLKTDALYQNDLQKIADFCGCKYVSRFIFPDGHIINTNG